MLLTPDLKFGSPSSQLQHESSPQRGPLPSLIESFSTLSRAFTSVRENLPSFHQREKEYYDLGDAERILPPGDIGRGKLKSRAKGPSKFQSEWSAPHEAVSIKGVIIILKTINSNRKIVVHHDRILSG